MPKPKKIMPALCPALCQHYAQHYASIMPALCQNPERAMGRSEVLRPAMPLNQRSNCYSGGDEKLSSSHLQARFGSILGSSPISQHWTSCSLIIGQTRRVKDHSDLTSMHTQAKHLPTRGQYERIELKSASISLSFPSLSLSNTE